MWNPWAVARQVASRSQLGALENARCAATELSRRRVERVEVELYVAQRARQRAGQRVRRREGRPA